MRYLLVFIIASLGCESAPTNSDASVADSASEASESCPGEINGCCEGSCDNDVGSRAWICVNGVRACPAGSYSDVECKKSNPCMGLFCALPSAIPQCISCDGGASPQSICDADAGHYICPSGTHSQEDPDAASTCAADAGSD